MLISVVKAIRCITSRLAWVQVRVAVRFIIGIQDHGNKETIQIPYLFAEAKGSSVIVVR